MKDAIDIRDTKRRIASSVVKWWDVKYLMDDEEENAPADFSMGYRQHSQSASHSDSSAASDDFDDTEINEEPEEVLEGTVEEDIDEEERKAQEMMNQMSEEDRQAALDIIERLNREAFEDDLKKSLEIEMLKAEMNSKEEE